MKSRLNGASTGFEVHQQEKGLMIWKHFKLWVIEPIKSIRAVFISQLKMLVSIAM